VIKITFLISYLSVYLVVQFIDLNNVDLKFVTRKKFPDKIFERFHRLSNITKYITSFCRLVKLSSHRWHYVKRYIGYDKGNERVNTASKLYRTVLGSETKDERRKTLTIESMHRNLFATPRIRERSPDILENSPLDLKTIAL